MQAKANGGEPHSKAIRKGPPTSRQRGGALCPAPPGQTAATFQDTCPKQRRCELTLSMHSCRHRRTERSLCPCESAFPRVASRTASQKGTPLTVTACAPRPDKGCHVAESRKAGRPPAGAPPTRTAAQGKAAHPRYDLQRSPIFANHGCRRKTRFLAACGYHIAVSFVVKRGMRNCDNLLHCSNAAYPWAAAAQWLAEVQHTMCASQALNSCATRLLNPIIKRCQLLSSG